ncbi:hypothetical protein TanjilG_11911 [Lupinus angustifolius]|uniref:ATP-dependent RNA helicase Ski2/MTR4 C-terminal domain-containing protein n=1 Tax=Lupinus angustifolius TaxID=3871 RepID=A0A1J7HZ66_LUPAN|nr:hypothetical protein TanjilG_11911 [Lupinus angustifolius]
MPMATKCAHKVVFDTVRKFDGKEFRQLLPGEYTQMAGRAGRRGLDKIGAVILMCRDELPEEGDLKHVTVGSATSLKPQFRLTYIMILHLLRVEELKAQDHLLAVIVKTPPNNKLYVVFMIKPDMPSPVENASDVLKEIGCIDEDLVVQMKGRVACEMNSGEELICTECLFENQLDELEPEEAVALMSAFVFQQKNTSEPSHTPKLSKAKHR